MLLGTYEPTLIGKNRLALPAKLRKEISGDRLVLAIGFEKCILGFEEKKWEEATASDLATALSDKQGRDLRRKMFSQAEVVELDSQGRIVVPESLISDRELKGEVVVIGAGDHFEIWNKKQWEDYRLQMEG